MIEKQSRKRNRPESNGDAATDNPAHNDATKYVKPTAKYKKPAGDDAAKDAKDAKPISKRARRRAVAATGRVDHDRVHKPSSAVEKIEVHPSEMMPQQRIDMIAELSEAILEDPSAAFTSSRTDKEDGGGGGGGGGGDDDEEGGSGVTKYRKTQSKAHMLLQLADLNENGYDARAARLAMLSLLAVFQDLVPSYRIRLPTDAERQTRVTKETKKLWDYEQGLLTSYQRYLKLLERTWEKGKFGSGLGTSGEGRRRRQTQGSPTTLAAAAMLSLCELLKTSYHFNFLSNLLQIIVKNANQRACDEVRVGCCGALSTLFATDIKGEAALEAVRMMAKIVASATKAGGGGGYKGNVHPDLIATFESLPLRVHEDEAQAAKLAVEAKKKQRHKDKQKYGSTEMGDIDRDLQEGEAGVDKIQLARNQSQALHAITVAYFRVLKLVEHTSAAAEDDSAVDGKDGDDGGDGGASRKRAADTAAEELLPVALSGLAKFAHLINFDAVVDLLAVLKDLLKRSNDLPIDAGLNCVLCAFKTLRGPGREMPIDPREYLIPLYNLIPRLGAQNLTGLVRGPESAAAESAAAVEDRTIVTAIECIELAFIKRQELSTARIAAFIKRIASAALHCPPRMAVPLLAVARLISARYASTAAVSSGLFESEEEASGGGAGAAGNGMYCPEAEDPDHSGAQSTPCWELAALVFHVHPQTVYHAKGMAKKDLLRLPSETPTRIRKEMGRDAAEGYVKQKFVWKKHPLHQAKSKGDDGKRKNRRQRQQVRFITPRKTQNLHFLPATSFSML